MKRKLQIARNEYTQIAPAGAVLSAHQRAAARDRDPLRAGSDSTVLGHLEDGSVQLRAMVVKLAVLLLAGSRWPRTAAS
ncbi:MAG: hypothetical protein JNL87_19640 [Burkholderiaceae bacterium]|nr:hypothetical protein [Burkholderiaceae bacterium]